MKKILPLILAGGKGTRLGYLTKETPKPLMKVNKKLFIKYLLDQLIIFGYEKVYISIGYKAEYFKKSLGAKYKNIEIFYISEEEELGTGGAILNSIKYIKSERVLVMNGDSYCDINLFDFKNSFKSYYDILIVVTKVNNSERYGSIITNSNGKIVKFNEKKKSENSLINAGIYIISKIFFKSLNFNDRFSLENDVLSECAKNNFYSWYKKAKFIDIGTPQSLMQASKFFMK